MPGIERGQVHGLLKRRAGDAVGRGLAPVLQVTLDPRARGDFLAGRIGFRHHPVHPFGGGVHQEKQQLQFLGGLFLDREPVTNVFRPTRQFFRGGFGQ